MKFFVFLALLGIFSLTEASKDSGVSEAIREQRDETECLNEEYMDQLKRVMSNSTAPDNAESKVMDHIKTWLDYMNMYPGNQKCFLAALKSDELKVLDEEKDEYGDEIEPIMMNGWGNSTAEGTCKNPIKFYSYATQVANQVQHARKLERAGYSEMPKAIYDHLRRQYEKTLRLLQCAEWALKNLTMWEDIAEYQSDDTKGDCTLYDETNWKEESLSFSESAGPRLPDDPIARASAKANWAAKEAKMEAEKDAAREKNKEDREQQMNNLPDDAKKYMAEAEKNKESSEESNEDSNEDSDGISIEDGLDAAKGLASGFGFKFSRSRRSTLASDKDSLSPYVPKEWQRSVEAGRDIVDFLYRDGLSYFEGGYGCEFEWATAGQCIQKPHFEAVEKYAPEVVSKDRQRQAYRFYGDRCDNGCVDAFLDRSAPIDGQKMVVVWRMFNEDFIKAAYDYILDDVACHAAAIKFNGKKDIIADLWGASKNTGISGLILIAFIAFNL